MKSKPSTSAFINIDDNLARQSGKTSLFVIVSMVVSIVQRHACSNVHD